MHRSAALMAIAIPVTIFATTTTSHCVALHALWHANSHTHYAPYQSIDRSVNLCNQQAALIRMQVESSFEPKQSVPSPPPPQYTSINTPPFFLQRRACFIDVRRLSSDEAGADISFALGCAFQFYATSFVLLYAYVLCVCCLSSPWPFDCC